VGGSKRDRGITANAVAPGEIATPMTGQTDHDPHETPQPGIPVGRPGDAREVAAVIAFLARRPPVTSRGRRGPWTVGCSKLGPKQVLISPTMTGEIPDSAPTKPQPPATGATSQSMRCRGQKEGPEFAAQNLASGHRWGWVGRTRRSGGSLPGRLRRPRCVAPRSSR
jgi:hypothetical protein